MKRMYQRDKQKIVPIRIKSWFIIEKVLKNTPNRWWCFLNWLFGPSEPRNTRHVATCVQSADLGPGAGKEAVSEYNGHEGQWGDVTNGQNDRIQPNPFRHSSQNSTFTFIFNLSVMVSTLRNNIAGKDSWYLQTFRGFALIETLVWLAAW